MKILDDLEVILEDPLEPLDWRAVFDRNAPVEVEVGFGKGTFLVRSAQENPDLNYFGMEHSRKYLRIIKEKAIRRGVKENLRLLLGDARTVTGLISDASVQRFHIYYPDPWPRRRHAKRRLFTPDFVRRLERSMVPGGEARLATDSDDYRDFILLLIEEETRLSIQEFDPGLETRKGSGVTGFDAKYRTEGRAVSYLSFMKKGT